MKNAKSLRMVVDAAMIVLLPCLMAYSLIGELFHEVAGVVMLGLFIAHHILNRNWLKGLFRGRYSPYRAFLTVVNLLLCVVMVCLPLSGIAMSKRLFRFLPTQGLSAAARTVHLFLSYWGYVLMCLHLGLHLDTMIRKKPKWLTPVAGAASLYGVYAFFHRQFPDYMTLRSQFVFFDYSEPRLFFFADYLAIMALFATAGCVVGRALQRRNYDRSGTDQNSL